MASNGSQVPSIDFNADYSMTIGGQAVRTKATLSVVNPATGEGFAEAPAAGVAELDAAVAAARAAFPAWRALPIVERWAVSRPLPT